RYPGDQRPLLLWECPRDGAYTLYVRCFRDKAGGRLYLRSVIYDTVDVSSGKMVEHKFDKQTRFLLNVPMKAGHVKQILTETRDPNGYASPQAVETISPTGLPDAHLESGIDKAIPSTLVAPVDGVYYVLESIEAYDSEKPGKLVKMGVREITPTTPARVGGG